MESNIGERFTNLVNEAKAEDAVEEAIAAFWSVIVEKHWLDCNADRCEDCGKKILSVKDACFEMANMTCVNCFSKKQLV